MASFPRGLMRAIGEALLEATDVDPNAASMLYPVSRTSRAAQNFWDDYSRGADAEQLWRRHGLTISPDPLNSGVVLGPRSWADARMTDEIVRGEPNYASLDTLVSGAPLPPNLRERIDLRIDPSTRDSYALINDSDTEIGLGTEGLDLGPGDPAPGVLAHEGQHAAAARVRGVPQGTSVTSATASPFVQAAFADDMPLLKAIAAQMEDSYWANPTAQNREAMAAARRDYEIALSNPESMRAGAGLQVYRDELGEGLAEWASANVRNSREAMLAGPEPFTNLPGLNLNNAFIGSRPLRQVYAEASRANPDAVKRLADFFKIISALGGLGATATVLREALRSELEREAA